MSSELIFEVTGRNVIGADGARLAHAVDAAGLDSGAEIWLAQLERVHEPMRGFFEEATPDAGGREPDFARHQLIIRLAEVSPVVLGRKATATAGGPFVRLVASVVNACGLDDTGIERAVERALKTVAKRKR